MTKYVLTFVAETDVEYRRRVCSDPCSWMLWIHVTVMSVVQVLWLIPFFASDYPLAFSIGVIYLVFVWSILIGLVTLSSDIYQQTNEQRFDLRRVGGLKLASIEAA